MQDQTFSPGKGRPRPCRVLVADDSAIARAVLHKQLSDLGCETTLASDGAEALAQWKQVPVDLILSDLQMPGMDGFDLARAVRAHEHFGQRPRTGFVAVSGRADDTTAAACRDLDMDAFTAKPISTERIRDLLARFASHPLADPADPGVNPALPRCRLAADVARDAQSFAKEMADD